MRRLLQKLALILLVSVCANHSFAQSGPTITSLNPNSGPVGTVVTIAGTSFGATQGTSTITFNGTTATPTNWNDTSIVVPVPNGATSGNVLIAVGGVASNGVYFTVIPPPYIASLSPICGTWGTSVTIRGTAFGATQSSSTVAFNGRIGTPTGWSDTSIAVPVPNGATSGNVVVTVGALASNRVTFTVTTGAPCSSSGVAVLVSLTVSSANSSVAAGDTTAFTATGTYSDNSIQDVTAIAAWTSSDPTIAVIDATGVVTSIDNGQVVIQATVGSVSGSATLTVTPGQFDGIITPTYQPGPGSGSCGFGCPNQKAIAVGADGFSRFLTGSSSSSGSADEVVYIRCLDADCSTFHTATFSTGNFTSSYSIGLGPDGFARIAYSTNHPHANGQSALHFIRCSDDDCLNALDMYVDDGSDNGIAGIAVGSDGTSYLVYDDGTDNWTPQSEYNQGVGMATCTAGGCTIFHIASISIYDVIGAVIAIGADGHPAIVYEDSGHVGGTTPDSVHYYTNGSNVKVSSNGAGGLYTQDVAIGPDGFARIAYVNAQHSADFIRCTDALCDPPSASQISFSGPYKQAISMAVGPDGNALIEGGSQDGTLKAYIDYFRCRKPDCSKYSHQIVPGSWENPWQVSLKLGSDGLVRMIGQNGRVDHIRRVPGFDVQYRSYIPADHVDGPDFCGVPPTQLIYKGDAPGNTIGAPATTFRTRQFLKIVPDAQVSAFYDARTGETRNYGAGSPANRSTLNTLSVLDEDGIRNDCILWNDADHANTLGFSQQVSYPQAGKGLVHFSGSAFNPLETPSATITWDMSITIDTTNPHSPTAQVNYNHTCYPAHQVTVNGRVAYEYRPIRNDIAYITGCLLLQVGKVSGQGPVVPVTTQ